MKPPPPPLNNRLRFYTDKGDCGMIRRIIIGLSALTCCAATSSSSSVNDLAGRYDKSFIYIQYGAKNVISARDSQDDVVEIVPVSNDAAYFRIAFVTITEDECGMSGIAHVEGRRLVYVNAMAPDDGGTTCKLTIERAGDKLRILDQNGDDEGACTRQHCGESGFLGKDLPWSSKRAIKYLARLKASHEYLEAVSHWQKGTGVSQRSR